MEGLKTLSQALDGVGVDVEAQNAAVRVAGAQDGFGVTTGSGGCVHIPALPCRPQMFHHCRRHDGEVSRAVPFHNLGGGCGVEGRLFTPHLTP